MYTGKWANAGGVFAWFGSSVGFFVVVVCPCIVFLIYEIISFTKTMLVYKQEKQMDSITNNVDPIQQKIALKKQAFDELVKDGTLTQEQADASLQKYMDKLLNEEDN